MIQKLAVVAILFCVSAAAFADSEADCPSVRLDSPGGNFAQIPVYDQKKYSTTDSGICYAVTTSALVDDYRLRHGEKLNQLTAPLSLALNYKVAEQKKPKDQQSNLVDADGIGGGSMRKTLAANQKKAICDQRYLENFGAILGSQNLKQRPTGQTSTHNKSINNFVSSILDQIHAYEIAQNSVSGAQKKMKDAKTAETSPINDFFGCRIVEGATSSDQILEAAKASANPASQMDGAQKFISSLCKSNSLKIQTPEMQEFSGYPSDPTTALYAHNAELSGLPSDSPKRKVLKAAYQENFGAEPRAKRVKNKINEMLAGKKIPVGIEYCAEILKGGSNCEPHASVLIGQRFNTETNSCELLIRNSFGKSCADRKKEPLYVYPCEEGNIWIRADALIKKTATLNWIE